MKVSEVHVLKYKNSKMFSQHNAVIPKAAEEMLFCDLAVDIFASEDETALFENLDRKDESEFYNKPYDGEVNIYSSSLFPCLELHETESQEFNIDRWISKRRLCTEGIETYQVWR